MSTSFAFTKHDDADNLTQRLFSVAVDAASILLSAPPSRSDTSRKQTSGADFRMEIPPDVEQLLDSIRIELTGLTEYYGQCDPLALESDLTQSHHNRLSEIRGNLWRLRHNFKYSDSTPQYLDKLLNKHQTVRAKLTKVREVVQDRRQRSELADRVRELSQQLDEMYKLFVGYFGGD